jgi:hypothetical protein
VQRADALDYDHASRLHYPLAARRAGIPIVRGETRGLAQQKRVDDLLSQTFDVEAVTPPELVRRDDLCVKDRSRECRLAGAAVAPDAHQHDAVPRLGRLDELEYATDVHARTVLGGGADCPPSNSLLQGTTNGPCVLPREI